MSERALCCAAGVVAVALLGCGEDVEPRAQWVVTLATDAPLPQFGDRLLIEVLDEAGNVCDGCRRLTAPAVGDWPLSFGLAPEEEGDEPRLRVRLFRSSRTGTGGLPTGPHIDMIGTLPPLAGVTDAEMILGMNCFGVPASPAERLSCSPATGELAPEALLAPGATSLPDVGSWPPAQRVDCPTPPPAGMVCVPGGVFLLGGSPDLIHIEGGAALPERLVRLDPFAIDIDEMTVGEFKALQIAIVGFVPPCALAATGDPDQDARPMDCAPKIVAENACARLQKEILTEAQWEYAAGQAALETTYPWGESTDFCAMSALGIGPIPEPNATIFSDFSCRSATEPVGPRIGGHENDVTDLGVRNLGGNMSEWVADRFAPYDDPCWSPGVRLLENPICVGAETADLLSFRGCAFLEQKSLSRAYHRWKFDFPALLAVGACPPTSNARGCAVFHAGIRCGLNYH